MATKRYIDDLDSNHEHGQEKENDQRQVKPRNSLFPILGEASKVISSQNFFGALEPLLRKVVNEEVENTLKRCSPRTFTRSPSLQIESGDQQPFSSLQLMFTKKLSLPIFTGSKIVDEDCSPLQILLVQTISGDQMIRTSLPQPIKIEIVALDGEFPSNERQSWSSEEFDQKIVKERLGKRPLIAGDCMTVTLRDGIAQIGEIEFTDNSSWIRSRKFRIGARVTPESLKICGVKIREAMTEAFVVKDHRGELYKKHYPPSLGDEVWRLEKIGKDGAFHQKLASQGINTVQDFLKLSIMDQQKLRKILGMSDKMWQATVKHARTCELGNKNYVFRRGDCTITLNSICQPLRATIHGQSYFIKDLSNINRAYIDDLVREAYANWTSLEEVVERSSAETPALLAQGENILEQFGYASDHHHYGYNNSNMQICNDWEISSSSNPTFHHAGNRSG